MKGNIVCMGVSPFSRSQKRYIRKEKARIRREVFDVKERQELMQKLQNAFFARKKEKEPASVK